MGTLWPITWLDVTQSWCWKFLPYYVSILCFKWPLILTIFSCILSHNSLSSPSPYLILPLQLPSIHIYLFYFYFLTKSIWWLVWIVNFTQSRITWKESLKERSSRSVGLWEIFLVMSVEVGRSTLNVSASFYMLGPELTGRESAFCVLASKHEPILSLLFTLNMTSCFKILPPWCLYHDRLPPGIVSYKNLSPFKYILSEYFIIAFYQVIS